MHPLPEVPARLLDLIPCESAPNQYILLYPVLHSGPLVKDPLNPRPDALSWLPLVLLPLRCLVSFLLCCARLVTMQVMLGLNPSHQAGNQERK